MILVIVPLQANCSKIVARDSVTAANGLGYTRWKLQQVFVENHSCENAFYLQVSRSNLFSYEGFCMGTLFETEVQGN